MKKKKSERLVTVMIFLVCLVLGGGFGYGVVEYFEDVPAWMAGLRVGEAVLIMFVAVFLQIILHEAGHGVAALIRGWRFISFMIMGWVISRKDGRFHLSRFNIPGAGGQCLMLPPEEGDTDGGIAFYNAGGVLMNCIVALVSLGVVLLYGRALPWELMILFSSLVFVGAGFALINGIPAVMGGLPNDGKNIQQLRKDAFSTKVFLTTMRAIGLMQQGQTIEQIATDYLCDGRQLDYNNPIHQMALSFDISLAMARLDFEKAHALFADADQHQDEIVDIYRNELTFERIYLYLVSPREECTVDAYNEKDFTQYMNAQCSFRPTALRTKYAYTRLHEHNEEEAVKLYAQFQKVCERYHIQGEVQTEKKLVDYCMICR